jgi:hypothetical protein
MEDVHGIEEVEKLACKYGYNHLAPKCHASKVTAKKK